LKTGAVESGLPLLRRRVEVDPLSEEASIDLMRALGMTGNRAGVEKEYARLVRALAEELEGEPEPGTREAYAKARAMETVPPHPSSGKVVPLRKVRRRGQASDA